jgi:hypothetical protein
MSGYKKKNHFFKQNLLLCLKIRDSIARVRHLYWLENEVKNGRKVTEVSSAKELENFQKYTLFSLKN